VVVIEFSTPPQLTRAPKYWPWGQKPACEAISKGKSKKGTVAAALGHQYVTTNLTVAHSSRTTLFDRLLCRAWLSFIANPCVVCEPLVNCSAVQAIGSAEEYWRAAEGCQLMECFSCVRTTDHRQTHRL